MGGWRTGTGNTRQGGSSSGGKLTNMMDERRTTEHQVVGGRKLGEKSLRSGPNRWERSDPIPEKLRTRQTDSIQQVPKDTVGGCGIHITTLDIRLGRAGVLETALHTLHQGNIGIRVLQEKNSPEAFTRDGDWVTRYV